ncbi:aldehyde dehydrogenase [Aeromicrobium sp. CFBP 8757]|nr:aldehyde dehydrogenase [Aeromicrobium sp. CFBP 8757]
MEPSVTLNNSDKFYIGGEWVAPSTDSTFALHSGATEEVFATVAEAQEADLDRAVAAARQAFDHGPWPRMTHVQRAGYLTAFADELERRVEQISTLWTYETGAILPVTQYGAAELAEVLRFHASLATTYPFETSRNPGPNSAAAGLVVREPVGVVGAIVPWNGPAMMMVWKAAPALLTGCTIIIKASPEAPAAGYVLAEIADSIGLPPGVFNVITADREVSELLVRHRGVDKISFTGSTAAGRKIGSILGGRLGRATLELGGKSPAIVLDDYDIDAAADALAFQASFITGQVCGSLTRVIVTKNRHDALVDALAARFAATTVGDPFDPATMMGPLASEAQRTRVEGYIAQGVAEGARLVTGGHRPAGLDRGYFIEPTLFAGVSNDHVIAREEIFGPVTSVIAAEDEADAVRIANDTDFGLSGAVFTGDVERAYSVARQLRTGAVSHNAFRLDPWMGFGGFKQSGIGREGGIEGVSGYLETKSILLDSYPAHVSTPVQSGPGLS